MSEIWACGNGGDDANLSIGFSCYLIMPLVPGSNPAQLVGASKNALKIGIFPWMGVFIHFCNKGRSTATSFT